MNKYFNYYYFYFILFNKFKIEQPRKQNKYLQFFGAYVALPLVSVILILSLLVIFLLTKAYFTNSYVYIKPGMNLNIKFVYFKNMFKFKNFNFFQITCYTTIKILISVLQWIKCMNNSKSQNCQIWLQGQIWVWLKKHYHLKISSISSYFNLVKLNQYFSS